MIVKLPHSTRNRDYETCWRKEKRIRKSPNQLHLSIGTVKNHITQILQKTELRDRTQLAIHALKHDLMNLMNLSTSAAGFFSNK